MKHFFHLINDSIVISGHFSELSSVKKSKCSGRRVQNGLMIPRPLNPDLGLAFGHVINPGGSELEEAGLPRLLAVLFEVQDPFQVGHHYGRPTEVLLFTESVKLLSNVTPNSMSEFQNNDRENNVP